MVRHLCLTALIAMSLAVWAQLGYAQANAESPAPLYKLEGTVVNAGTGHPIPRALVEVESDTLGKRAMLTGAEGEFSFDKLAQGAVSIGVKKPGFFEPGRRGEEEKPAKLVEIGPKSGKLTLKLEPECVIAGEVINNQGEPVEGAMVEALESQIVEGHRELIPIRSYIRTDEDGLFRLAGLQSGRYFLSVKAGPDARPLLGDKASSARQSYPLLTYFPGVTDLASATPINLVPGQHAHAQISLSVVPVFKLSGTILGVANFKRIQPPTIVDASEQTLAATNHWDPQTGAFEFPPLPAAVYTLRVYAQIDDNHAGWATQTVTLNRDTSGANLALSAVATIPVSVRTEFTQQRDCSVEIFGSGGNRSCKQFPAEITLMSAESRQIQAQAQPENDDPSTLALRQVLPGKYRVQVVPVVQAYVRSVRSGTTDLLREDLIVPAGGTIAPIEVVLRDDGAKVNIHIQAENRPEHVRILLLPESAPEQRALTINSSGTDDLEYRDLPPGEYKVLAFESQEQIEYQNPDVMQKYSAKTARITLTAKGSTNVTVELIREGE
jgi:hypothetical protein